MRCGPGRLLQPNLSPHSTSRPHLQPQWPPLSQARHTNSALGPSHWLLPLPGTPFSCVHGCLLLVTQVSAEMLPPKWPALTTQSKEMPPHVPLPSPLLLFLHGISHLLTCLFSCYPALLLKISICLPQQPHAQCRLYSSTQPSPKTFA